MKKEYSERHKPAAAAATATALRTTKTGRSKWVVVAAMLCLAQSVHSLEDSTIEPAVMNPVDEEPEIEQAQVEAAAMRRPVSFVNTPDDRTGGAPSVSRLTTPPSVIQQAIHTLMEPIEYKEDINLETDLAEAIVPEAAAASEQVFDDGSVELGRTEEAEEIGEENNALIQEEGESMDEASPREAKQNEQVATTLDSSNMIEPAVDDLKEERLPTAVAATIETTESEELLRDLRSRAFTDESELEVGSSEGDRPTSTTAPATQIPPETTFASQERLTEQDKIDKLYSLDQADRQELLQELHYQANFANTDGHDDDNVAEDDRTLLDIFGEAAKEYLTQKVIPPTDVECVWDWRSIRCEPACDCHWRFQSGDYHLGRSCRLREEVIDQCQNVDPATVHGDKPIPKRILSLLHTTVHLVKSKTQNSTHNLWNRAQSRVTRLQERVCTDIWDLQSKCWPHSTRLPTMTIPERVLCGPLILWNCDGEKTTTTTAWESPPLDKEPSSTWNEARRQADLA